MLLQSIRRLTINHVQLSEEKPQIGGLQKLGRLKFWRHITYVNEVS